MNVSATIFSLLFLILFGLILQRLHFFEEVSFKRLQSFLLKVTIPCMLFTAFVNMEFHQSQMIVSIGMFFFMLILLLVGVLLYRVLPIKHDFFMFSFCAFGFGTVGFPVFVELFGMENAAGMMLLGMGHEVFIAGIFIPTLHIYYSKTGAKFHAFLSPTILMVLLGAVLGIGNFGPVIAGNAMGAGLLSTLSRLGSLTLPLALILTGYRLKLGDRRYLKTSILYAAARLIVTISLGLAFKALFLDTFTPSIPHLDHAFYTLLFQHGPIILMVYVGLHRPMEDQTIANNAFVLSLAVGVLLFFLYMLIFV